MQFEEFLPYVSTSQDQKTIVPEKEKILSEQTPDDLIDLGLDEINSLLKNELLDKLKTVDPTFFEKLILHLVETWA